MKGIYLKIKSMNSLTKKKFYFVRHGKTDWNSKQLCQGQIDIPLNQEGKDEVYQISTLISKLPISKIFVSPLRRALESAQIIQEQFPAQLTIIDDLKERGWGTLEGASSIEMYQIEENEELDPHYILGYNIEPRNMFRGRIVRGINIALEEEKPLIISHGRVFLVLCEILSVPLIRQIPNATLIECNPFDNGWQLKFHSQ